jgi:hypothetical protein
VAPYVAPNLRAGSKGVSRVLLTAGLALVAGAVAFAVIMKVRSSGQSDQNGATSPAPHAGGTVTVNGTTSGNPSRAGATAQPTGPTPPAPPAANPDAPMSPTESGAANGAAPSPPLPGGAPAAATHGCPPAARLVQASGVTPYCIDLYEYPGAGQQPTTGVDLAAAGDLCAKRGERLCDGDEWQAACVGPGGASYPYGDTFTASKCNTAQRDNSDPKQPVPAGSLADCVSPVGAYDMSGNVAEWTTSGAIFGGSSQQAWKDVRCSTRVVTDPSSTSPYVGFRCCADAPNR